MSASPTLSIGIPVLNGERYLAEALESALRQRYPNLEVLISDNASTDSTPEICARFEGDPRVTYVRSAETTHPVANFSRVLSMAGGTYFTWLAHDDLLTSPEYASTMVATLEANPDAVLCASALEVFREGEQPMRHIHTYPRVASVEPWRRTRRALFRWPPGGWESLIYGVFRRKPLKREVARTGSLRYVLQHLAFEGRFIVVPTPLRAFRLHDESLARERVSKSELQLLLTGLGLKSQLLWEAARAPAPPPERIRLVGTGIRNFLGNHLAWASSVRDQIRAQEAELGALAAAAQERRALIRQRGDRPPEGTHLERAPRGSRSPGWLRRPDAGDAAYLAELTAQVDEARRVCDELLAAIDGKPLHG